MRKTVHLLAGVYLSNYGESAEGGREEWGGSGAAPTKVWPLGGGGVRRKWCENWTLIDRSEVHLRHKKKGIRLPFYVG
jgi:hypothetical protein